MLPVWLAKATIKRITQDPAGRVAFIAADWEARRVGGGETGRVGGTSTERLDVLIPHRFSVCLSLSLSGGNGAGVSNLIRPQDIIGVLCLVWSTDKGSTRREQSYSFDRTFFYSAKDTEVKTRFDENSKQK